MLIFLLIPLPFLTGCSGLSKTEAEAQSNSSRSKAGERGISVDVEIAKTEVLQEPFKTTGTTQPVREVWLRAQVEGRLLSLQADVGDLVQRGQILARLDDSLLQTSVTQGQAELAALQSEVARAQTQVTNAQAQAEQARAELKQAQVDAARLRSLSSAGAIAKQQAEVAQTEAATAQQRLNAAISQIATEQQAVAAARGRVEAQRATIAQAQERQSYTLLASPITGVVVAKSEPGNLIQPGGEVLRLGDFSSVKVVVQVSDKELSNIQVGQSVQVDIDAFANEKFTGKVTRILPASTANSSTLQVPVEITIPNNNGKIGNGLFAKVTFEQRTQPRVVIPETALQGERERGSRRGGAPVPVLEQGSDRKSNSAVSRGENPQFTGPTVFVVTGEGDQAKAQARRVQVGTSANNKVEILSGLKPGERFVTGSANLKDGDKVRLSILSKTPEQQEQR
jgi:multidrug efflux pump subunit AcrA (membrane-fusion protein)